MASRSIALAGLSLLLAACGAGVRGQSRAFADAHPDCDVSPTVRERVGQEAWDVEACGIRESVHVAGRGYGRRFFVSSEALRLAAFETGCPAESMQVAALTESQVGVSGCGHRRIYRVSEQGWVLNSAEGIPSEQDPSVVPSQ
jgi:hypothetical protein